MLLRSLVGTVLAMVLIGSPLLIAAEGAFRQITTNPGVDIEPKWSPDGNWLSYGSATGERHNLWIVPSGGGSPTQLTTDLVYVHSSWWSPDGKTIAFSGGLPADKQEDVKIHVHLISPEGGEPRKLTDGPIDGAPCFSPDGQKIAFVSIRSGNWDIWIQPVNGGDAVQLTDHAALDHSARWSPDGSKLTFHSMRSGNADIWVVPAAGGDPEPLTISEAEDMFPSWSPDGQKIAFQSNRTGNEDIYVLSLKDKGLSLITSDPAKDGRPTWSPDGNEIAFSSDRCGNLDLWVVDLRKLKQEDL
jgi:Tol biopolymer transport system component